MVENRMYRPLQGKRPLDVTIQDREGILYYLYEDHYLSNAHAGKPFGSFSCGLYTHIAVNACREVLLTGKKNYALMRSGKDTMRETTADAAEGKLYGNDSDID